MKSRQIITRTPVSGKNGVVAAAREPSVEAGIRMLERGGTAMDAAVAAALVAGVMEPMETTLAGSGFMLVAQSGEIPISIEFGPRAPAAATPAMYVIDEQRQIDRGLGVSMVVGDENVQSARSAGVPATLAGLAEGHARFGRLPWATVMEPAIAVAAEGFDVDPYFALEALDNLDALRADPVASSRFLVNGLPPPCAHLGSATLGAPHRLKQETLARTLEIIATKGTDALFQGPLGAQLVETHREQGGLLRTQDLACVKPVVGPARHMRFRDVDVWVPHAPCGALTQLQMLTFWQALYPDAAPATGTEEHLLALANVSWHAFADRYHWLGDPDFVPVPEAGLLSSSYAQMIADRIRRADAPPRCTAPGTMPWNHFAAYAAHNPWAYDPAPARAVAWSPEGSTEPTAGTTHISVVDGEGMAVSLTHTAANHFGAKVVCPRTGLLLDAAMGWFNARPNAANSIAGGKRPLANMAPMLLTRNGNVLAALGAPGGRRIISAVTQLAMGIVEGGMDAIQAVHAPRIDASGSTILASERLSALANGDTIGGYPVRWVREQHQGFGYEMARPIIAVRDGDSFQAATDPFTQGHARSK